MTFPDSSIQLIEDLEDFADNHNSAYVAEVFQWFIFAIRCGKEEQFCDYLKNIWGE